MNTFIYIKFRFRVRSFVCLGFFELSWVKLIASGLEVTLRRFANEMKLVELILLFSTGRYINLEKLIPFAIGSVTLKISKILNLLLYSLLFICCYVKFHNLLLLLAVNSAHN